MATLATEKWLDHTKPHAEPNEHNHPCYANQKIMLSMFNKLQNVKKRKLR